MDLSWRFHFLRFTFYFASPFFCQRVEIAAARLQHSCWHQLLNGIQYSFPFSWLISRCLEQHMQIQAILPHFFEYSQDTQGKRRHFTPH
jgi:hypothetical protein